MENQEKPDWITDEQWAIRPNVNHWERSRKAIQSLEQLRNLPRKTHKEVVEQQRRAYEKAGLSTEHFDYLSK